MAVFMAGAISLGQVAAIMVVVVISSAMPFAILPMISAEAGAIRHTSAAFAAAMCSTSNLKFRSNVSMRHLLLVSVSNVTGVTNFAPFGVRVTVTLTPSFMKALAISHAL